MVDGQWTHYNNYIEVDLNASLYDPYTFSVAILLKRLAILNTLKRWKNVMPRDEKNEGSKESFINLPPTRIIMWMCFVILEQL